MKKFVSYILFVSVVISCINIKTADAASILTARKNITENVGVRMKFLKITDKKLQTSRLRDKNVNLIKRNSAEVNRLKTNNVFNSEADEASNTNPNYAYVVENGSVYQGNIKSEKEFRWYCFNITEKSKVTIALQMADTLNADLFIFKYDTKANSLNLVDGSVSEGLGVAENYSSILNDGIYFFAVYGKEGTGKFGLAFYNSSKDVNYEVNDSLSTATGASIDAKDPSTGKLIDIENFNYFYDYAVGSNSLTFTRRYPNMAFFSIN